MGDGMKDECKIDIRKAALSAGLLWGGGIFFAGLFAAASGSYAVAFVNAIGSIYPGYAPTYAGSIIGGIWGLLDGGAAGALFAYLYNKL
jgi:hypothetical protein